MARNLDNLSGKSFDILVIGGGIHGAVAAWDAALRGLSVALIEKNDFGSVTSQNSLRIIHGGLRYLQDGNPMRVWKMAHERSIWMKIAPHLVHPLFCIMPTFPKISRSRIAMGIALAVNDVISIDRNRAMQLEKHIPPGQLISKEECLHLLKGYDRQDITGAAVWHDGQIYNSERLLFEFIQSAVSIGTVAHNYVEALKLLIIGNQVVGIQAMDVFTGEMFEIHSKVVLNCTGAWVSDLLGKEKKKISGGSAYEPSIAMNLVVNGVWPGLAAGLPARAPGKKKSQIFFIVPWRHQTIIGTWHLPWSGPPEEFQLSKEILKDFLEAVNNAHPLLDLQINDIHHVQLGFLPAYQTPINKSSVELVRDGKSIDHEKEDGIAGIISLIGVKYTTARLVSREAVDLAVKKAGLQSLPSKTHSTQLIGGKIENFTAFMEHAKKNSPVGFDPKLIEHLVYTYGANFHGVVQTIMEKAEYLETLSPDFNVTIGEVVHAVRHEMPLKLADVVQRRTELGTTSLPSEQVLRRCAEIMGDELGWDKIRQSREIDEVRKSYPLQTI